jgi:hypothetical protein
MEAARIEAFYAALQRRPSSMRTDSEEGSVRLVVPILVACLHAHALARAQYHGSDTATAAMEASQVLTEDMLSGKQQKNGIVNKAAAAPATALASSSGSHRGSDNSRRSLCVPTLRCAALRTAC